MWKTKTDELKKEIEKNHNFNWRFQHFSLIDSRLKKKGLIEYEKLEKPYQPPYFIDIYRAFFPMTTEYILSIETCGPFTEIDHMQSHTINWKDLYHTEYVVWLQQNINSFQRDY